MCLFLPKTHLQLPDPSVNIPQNLHRLARSRSLPDTVVVCLPHITIQSAGHKPVSPLQEVPISSMEGSLVGNDYLLAFMVKVNLNEVKVTYNSNIGNKCLPKSLNMLL